MRANQGIAALAGMMLSGLLAFPAQAQSVWGGPGSTTNTTIYNLNTNWSPAGAPVAAGQSAIFKNNGKVNVIVTAPIAPDSWTFNANAKSFTLSGADVNFSLAGAGGGIVNKANAGQTISIGNNIGEVSAGVRVHQNGNSTLVLSGANTYSGNTTISAGTLVVTNSTPGSSSSVGTGNVVLDGGIFQADGASNLKFDNRFKLNAAGGAIDANGIALTLSGKISDGSGAGPLTILDTFGGGKVVFTGANTYSGGTTISSICNCTTLQLGTAGNSGSILGPVINEGAFSIVNSDTSGITTLTNQVGAITTFRNATGAGTMTINNIGGPGVGLVEFNKTSSAADATINNAGFSYVVFNDQATLAGAKIVNNDAATVLFAAKTDAGNVSASITNNGDAQLHFLNQSTAGRATIANNDAGVLDFNNHASAGNSTIVNASSFGMAFLNHSTAGNAFITTTNNSATFFFDHSDGGTARFETEAGSIVDLSGSRGLNNDGRINAGSIAGAGNYYIGAGNTLVAGGSDRSTEVSGVIADNNPCGCTSGLGALEKTGLGTLILSGANTYTGGTTITAGTLQLGNDGATGSVLGDIVNNTTLAFSRSNVYQFGGAISGSGELQHNGAGTTVLTAVNSYAGPTTINAGTLALSGAGSIANSSGVIDNATFDISATSAGASIKTLSGTGLVLLGSQPLTLTNASGGFDGVIEGSGGLIKQGAGLFALSGANTYTGATTVAGGNLQVTGSLAGAVTVQSGGTLSGNGSIAGSVVIQSGGTLSAGQSPGTLTVAALNLNAGSTSLFELGSPGVVGGASNDLVNVTGNLTLGGTLSVNAPSAGYYRLFNYGTLTPSGFDAITGSSSGTPTVLTNVPNQVNIQIAAAGQQVQFWDGADQAGNGVVNGGTGTWNATNTNWTGAPGQAAINDQWRSSVGVFSGSAGSVTVVGSQAFDTLQFSTTGYVLTAGAGGQLQLAGVSGAGTVNTDGGVSATVNVPIVNGSSQSLIKVGGGTLILTAANTYTGGTTISAGTLQLGNSGTSGSITGNVVNNATLAFNRLDTVTFGGAISGGGQLAQIGAGTTILTADNTYTGGTTINAGTLQLGNGGGSGSIVGNVADNGVLAINHSGVVAFNGVISGFGELRQTGTGITTLFADNTYQGLTTIAQGTLMLAPTGRISGSILNNATFIIDGALLRGFLTNNGLVSANGGSTNSGVLNSGQFNVGGSFSGAGGFGNSAGAILVIGAAATLDFFDVDNSGIVITAAGSRLNAFNLVNRAGGTITIASGASARSTNNGAGGFSNAGFFLNNGTAQVDVNSNSGTIVNGPTGTWNGRVDVNSGSITNNGAWTAHIVVPDSLSVNTGTFVNNGVYSSNANPNAAFVSFRNSGTLINSGIFNSSLNNTAGVTVNDGALNGSASVSGGTFTGTGSVTNLAVSGGTFAPGNGTPGTFMTVTGNLGLQSGAMYLVTLNPTTASFASVGGTAALNGTAAAVYLAGNYVSKKYTILTATGGVSGTFGSLVNTNVPANFSSTLSYDANNAYINLALNFSPTPAPNFGGGLNVNQQNVGNALIGFFNTSGGIPLAFGALSPRGLTQASGELATASQQTTFDAMNLFLGLLTDPFMGRYESAGSPTTAPQFAEEASAYASSGKSRSKSEREAYAAIARKAPIRNTVYDPRWSVWAAGFGGSQTTDGNGALGSNTATSRVFGTAVGADYLFSPRTLAGVAIAGGGSNFSVNGLGTGRSDLFQAGAYLRHKAGPAYLTAALAYGWQDITTDRTVGVLGGGQLHAMFNAQALSGRVESGYRFVTPWVVGLTPYAGGQFTTFDLPAYAEQAITGGNMFALNYGAKDVTATRSELGVRSDRSFAMWNGIVTLRGRAAWAHNFNPDRNISATFQTLPGASFVVNGAAQAGDAALVTASAEMKWLNGLSLAATFEGEFSGFTRSYAGKGVVRYAW